MQMQLGYLIVTLLATQALLCKLEMFDFKPEMFDCKPEMFD